ncbi:MAG TPA: CaiB/BaiF CoA-transferase family protein, partial [Acidimicrobiales bacterium]|nr:CaiB/BaiF CoA-transferase family protein [Acidimicrobiales bacterium]
LNSNKRGITLNLKHERGRRLLLEMVRNADVLIENFAPGTMDDLGLGPDVLLKANPRLIYGAATGYGIDGPDRDQLAMDITIQAHSGVMSVTGFPDQPPVKAGVAFVDFLGGTHLYGAVVTALYERERTGLGRVVDVAMIDTVYPTLASNLSGYYRDGEAPPSGNGHGGGAISPYNVYATKDGHVAIIVVTEQQWRNLCAAMEQPELAEDDRFRSNGRRYHNLDQLDAIVEAWTSSLDRDDVVGRLHRAKVPVAAVRTLPEVVEDRHLHERGAVVKVDHPRLGEVVLPQSPLRFRGSPVAPLVPSPDLGQDNHAVYRELLGLDDAEVEELGAQGVI